MIKFSPTTHFKADTIIDYLRYHAQHRAEQDSYIFLAHNGTERMRLTFSELFRRCLALAAVLEALELRGKTTALLFQPGLDFIVAFFSCLQAGTIAVPLHPPKREQELEVTRNLLSASEAKAILLDSYVCETLQKIDERWAGKHKVLCLNWLNNETTIDHLAQKFSGFQPQQQEIAFLQFTSGSTSLPKGVAVSHVNILNNQKVIEEGFEHSQTTKVVSWLPYYHDMGLIGSIMQPLYLGRPCILMSPFAFIQKPIRWLNAISQYQATTSGGPNFAYNLCLNAITETDLAHSQEQGLDLSAWRVAFIGAEPIQIVTLERFYDKFKSVGFRFESFYPCYGMSETTLMLTGISRQKTLSVKAVDLDALSQGETVEASNHSWRVKNVVNCGRTWQGNRVIVVNPKTKQQLEDNKIGEIWTQGPSIAQGYWGNPKATEQHFRAELKNVSGDFYLRTGDLGFLEKGELYITGRLKSLLIINGRNYYPHDIEATVSSFHPAFRAQSAVFEIHKNGEPRVVVVQEISRRLVEKIDLDLVRRKVRKLVSATYGIHLYDIFLTTDRLPLTTSGKIQREACRDAILNEQLTLITNKII